MATYEKVALASSLTGRRADGANAYLAVHQGHGKVGAHALAQDSFSQRIR